ncbi:MAG: porphobilinogen synthase [Candidatus Omnitrophota bacterium]
MPFVRLRHLRKNAGVRDLVSETGLAVSGLIMPYFVCEGKNTKERIDSLPGIYRLSIDNLIKDVKEAKNLGIKTVLIFGVSKDKDSRATPAYRKDGIVQKAVTQIKKDIGDIAVITDVCLCGYTTHGHCGIVVSPAAGRRPPDKFIIDNDYTLEILAKIALSHAKAGADFVAPSAMMDGQVKAIRDILDMNGFSCTKILGYSAKYASSFYGPFREALGSRPEFGDRKTYQMDYRNTDEALLEVGQDIKEGADIVMVKPALAYLDIISRVKQNFNIPLAAFNVSGEYSLVKEGAKKGIVNERDIILEILTAIKRAGADLIITYHAKEVAKWLRQ